MAMQTDASPADTTPLASVAQTVHVDGKAFTAIQEGLARILIPPEAPLLINPNNDRNKEGTQRASVFYNPIQQYNRDLTILVIKAFGEDFIAKARAVTSRRNAPKPKKSRKSNDATGPKVKLGEHSKEQPESIAPQPLQAITAKRQREPDEELSSSAVNAQADRNKRMRLGPLDPSLANDTQGQALFSSMVKDRVASQDDVDDSFGDGGIGEDDFLLAEQNAKQAEPDLLEPSESAPTTTNGVNGHSDVDKKPVFKILDALSASGLRALRYAKELPFVTGITANDLSADATKFIKRNIQFNELEQSGVIRLVNNNAIAHMANAMVNNGQKYTVIDLDPYGTAVPFLDTAIQAVSDGGLLCVTCTDTAIFNSMGYLEKCFSQYGGLPVKGDFCHEAGVRLILHAIATTAAKYGIAIEPLVSLSIDYYARVFVRVRKSSAEVKLLGGKTMLVYNCDAGCGAWTAQPLVRVQEKPGKKGDVFFKFTAAQAPTTELKCEHCGFKRHLAGPMWGGPLHNPAFLQRLLDSLDVVDQAVYTTVDRVRGMISTALEETSLYDVPPSVTSKASASAPPPPPTTSETTLPASKEFARVPAQIVDKHPFYFDTSSLSRVLRCLAPSNAQIQGALRHQGYRCVRSHAKAGSIKTDAPFGALWRIMRAWMARQGGRVEQREGTAGYGIMHNAAAAAAAAQQQQQQQPPSVAKDGGDVAEAVPEIVFDEVLGKQDASVRGLVRYQQNPRENWGPMAKARVTNKSKKQAADTA